MELNAVRLPENWERLGKTILGRDLNGTISQ